MSEKASVLEIKKKTFSFFSNVLSSLFILSLGLSKAKICLIGQEQRWQVEPPGPEEAALQEDATGALCHTIFSVSPISSILCYRGASKILAVR